MFRIVAVVCLIFSVVPLAGGAVVHDLLQSNKAFSAKRIEANVGDTLKIVNNDTVVHNVFSLSPGYEFDLGFQQPGAAASVLLSRAGRITMRCAIHPRMKAIVTVR